MPEGVPVNDPDIAFGSLPLTQDVVRKFFPVTPAHRREFLHCFAGLTLDQAKDDDLFYPHLTGMMNGDLTPIARFDKEMRRKGKIDKAFLYRCLRRLRSDFDLIWSPGEDGPDIRVLAEDESLPEEAGNWPTSRRAVPSRWRRQPTRARPGTTEPFRQS